MATAKIVNLEEISGQIKRVLFHKDTFFIGKLEDGRTIKGSCPSDGFNLSLEYRFMGKYEWNEQYKNNTFVFSSYAVSTPLTRSGVVAYLEQFASGFGEVRAHALVNEYGVQHAVNVLKSNPADVAKRIKGITLETAELASKQLLAGQACEETRIQLLALLNKQGFGGEAINRAIEIWGVNAADAIQRNPFVLMLKRVPGAGFARCDALWMKLGKPADGIKRQVMAVWHHMRSDSSGSTWYLKADMVEVVKQLVSGEPNPDRAIAIALRAKFLSQCERGGVLYLADRVKAGHEDSVFADICRLCEVRDDDAGDDSDSSSQDDLIAELLEI